MLLMPSKNFHPLLNRTVFLSLSLLLPVTGYGQSQSYSVSTYAGTGTAGYAGDGGTAASAQLNFPLGITLASGTLYIADQLNRVVRAINISNGTVSTYAGNNTAGFSGDGGAATKAQLQAPSNITVASNGNVYIADAGNSVIRLVTGGNISTIAGSHNAGAGYSGDAALATGAQLNLPYAVAVDSAGNYYIADANNNRIRKVTTDGNINSIAGGDNPEYTGDGGPALVARINHPLSIQLDGAGNIYFADTSNHAIRKIDNNGVITTIAGTGDPGYSGDGGPAKFARLNHPEAIAFDSAGNLYIADTFNQRIRRITTDGNINTIAGSGVAGYTGDGGAALAATFKFPRGVAVDTNGNVYVSDNSNSVIRLLTPSILPPAINANGVISAGAFGPYPSAAPGSWVEIYGLNLAFATRNWAVSDFTPSSAPTSLNGVSVTVDGQPAYLSYISPGQVNALIPSTVGTGLKSLVLKNSIGASTYSLQLFPTLPLLFAPPSLKLGNSQYVGGFLQSDNTIAFPVDNSTAFRRARAGDKMTLFGIGFGPVSGVGSSATVPAGGLTPVSTQLTGAFHIYFGGVEAQVTYAGLSPLPVNQGLYNAGLYQFNVVVPVGLPASDTTLVTFTLGGTAGPQTLVTAIGN